VLDVPLLRLDPELPVPSYARSGDAGADLYAAADIEIPAGQWRLVATGVAIALPPGFAGFVHPRSGLAARLGVTTLNAPGTVDAGYRGEIIVNLVNHGPAAVTVHRGDRIAQLVVQRVEQVRFIVTDVLSESERGSAGHGSTGGHHQLATAPQGGE
jgi:dUTP pyrophosphatase